MKYFKLILISLSITLILLVLLFVLKDYTLNHILKFFKDLRGTAHYQGETEAVENIQIITRIISPILFVLSLLFLNIFKKIKSNPQK